jgi:hypothetical protein
VRQRGVMTSILPLPRHSRGRGTPCSRKVLLAIPGSPSWTPSRSHATSLRRPGSTR